MSGRVTLDLLRALVCHQAHKLTTYSFAQAVSAVLGETTEEVPPPSAAGMSLLRRPPTLLRPTRCPPPSSRRVERCARVAP